MVLVVFWTMMIGFMCGAIAEYLTPQLKQGDIFISMTIGLIGSVLFEWLGSVVKLYVFGDVIGLVASFIGATSLLYFYHVYITTYGPPKSPDRPNS